MLNFKFAICNLQFVFCILQFSICTQFAFGGAPLAVPVSGEPFYADVLSVDGDWSMAFRTADGQKIVSAAELIRWGRCPDQGRAGGLVFSDGGFLAADATAADQENVAMRSDLFGTIKIPINSLAGIIFRQPGNATDADRLFNRILSPAPSSLPSLRLLLDNGDELTGHLTAIAGGVVKVQTDLGPVDVKADRISALIFAGNRDDGLSKKLRAWVGVSDGSRMIVSEMKSEGGTLKLTVARQSLSLPLDKLVFFQPLGGRAVYLSDIRPVEHRQTPFLDIPWPYRADRSVTGGFLRVGKQLFLKGIGVHSKSSLVYDISSLPSPLSFFSASLAIDDSAHGGGSVVFRVLVDGRERYASPIIRGGDAPTPISVGITGGNRLELIVDYADRADVLDRADWLDARVIMGE